jgi:hypothetical protein
MFTLHSVPPRTAGGVFAALCPISSRRWRRVGPGPAAKGVARRARRGTCSVNCRRQRQQKRRAGGPALDRQVRGTMSPQSGGFRQGDLKVKSDDQEHSRERSVKWAAAQKMHRMTPGPPAAQKDHPPAARDGSRALQSRHSGPKREPATLPARLGLDLQRCDWLARVDWVRWVPRCSSVPKEQPTALCSTHNTAHFSLSTEPQSPQPRCGRLVRLHRLLTRPEKSSLAPAETRLGFKR